MKNITRQLNNALNEKDVESAYRAAFSETIKDLDFSSPYGVDGFMQFKKVRALLEFKYNKDLKSKLDQSNILIQMLYYIKKFEEKGDLLPNVLFVGDKNECFAISTNAIIKYLDEDIDWKIAPSSAYKNNIKTIKALVEDVDILPFVFNIDNNFDIKGIITTIEDLVEGTVKKIKITKTNVVSIFEYFNEEVLPSSSKLTVNEQVNLFIQLLINPKDNYIHPTKKNSLVTEAFKTIKVDSTKFNSFFKHFDGVEYSPEEKEELTSLSDRLIEDEVRRFKGEFFTPTDWVDEAHNIMLESLGGDWKKEYLVWDCASGTGNLTRDYKFKNLYVSTLEQSDIDTMDQMGYNPEAVKFQFDFLNDDDKTLPSNLQEALKDPKVKKLFFINPPYGRSNGTSIKRGVATTKVQTRMKVDNWSASAQLYAQFMYKISQYENVTLANFSHSLYKTGGSFKKFRSKFYLKFEYVHGMLFNAGHFSDTSDSWGIDFSIWTSGETDKEFDIRMGQWYMSWDF